MRLTMLLLAGAALASCTTAPPPQQAFRGADKQAEFDKLLAGKVAQRPMNCLPHYSATDMRVIDENTIAFRDGPSRTFVGHTNGCHNLGNPSYALVTHLVGSADLCTGDIARVVDTTTGMMVGSCSFSQFTPFVRPRG